MIHFIVQARSGSTRLPNKILMPFYNNKSILELLIEKLKQVDNTKIIIATSLNTNCDDIEKVSSIHNVSCFRGSENDVLQRFIDAAEFNNSEKIIRVCSDNPFLELDSIKLLVSLVDNSEGIDYASFSIKGTPSIKTHYGFWTEFVTLEALKRAKKLTEKNIYHEHVTNFIYENSNLFNLRWIEAPSIIYDHPNIRLTIDTQEDFNIAQKIYSDLCLTKPYPTIKDIVNYLDTQVSFYTTMKKQIEKNSK